MGWIYRVELNFVYEYYKYLRVKFILLIFIGMYLEAYLQHEF
jgi:hypothetical protein